MQQPGGQTWNGGHRFQMWGPGTTGPPAGDGPAPFWRPCTKTKYMVAQWELTWVTNNRIFVPTANTILAPTELHRPRWEPSLKSSLAPEKAQFFERWSNDALFSNAWMIPRWTHQFLSVLCLWFWKYIHVKSVEKTSLWMTQWNKPLKTSQ